MLLYVVRFSFCHKTIWEKGHYVLKALNALSAKVQEFYFTVYSRVSFILRKPGNTVLGLPSLSQWLHWNCCKSKQQRRYYHFVFSAAGLAAHGSFTLDDSCIQHIEWWVSLIGGRERETELWFRADKPIARLQSLRSVCKRAAHPHVRLPLTPADWISDWSVSLNE